ncbi:MAG: hypothetical protein ICV64_06620 [Thermoleophilia bacterium]|nr:hypothetical protein [Thermoleophilia bacterium]
MARRGGRERRERPLPEPLPPVRRPVGQLVAEAIRLYGRRFWPSLALGVAPAALAVGAVELGGGLPTAVTVVAGPLVLAGTMVAATLVATGGDRRPASLARALLLALVAVTPLALSRVVFFPGVYLVVLAWFALTALAVPAVLDGGGRVAGGLRRGIALARADLVHAFGSVAALAIVVTVSSLALFFLLASFGEQTRPYAAFLSLLVVTPLFFLGTALLYFDQAARLGVGSGRKRRRRRGNADVHPALDTDGAGPPDAQVEPGTPARGEP